MLKKDSHFEIRIGGGSGGGCERRFVIVGALMEGLRGTWEYGRAQAEGGAGKPVNPAKPLEL